MVEVETHPDRRCQFSQALFGRVTEVFRPCISSDSHHPNPTQMERIYRAFLFLDFLPEGMDDLLFPIFFLL